MNSKRGGGLIYSVIWGWGRYFRGCRFLSCHLLILPGTYPPPPQGGNGPDKRGEISQGGGRGNHAAVCSMLHFQRMAHEWYGSRGLIACVSSSPHHRARQQRPCQNAVLFPSNFAIPPSFSQEGAGGGGGGNPMPCPSAPSPLPRCLMGRCPGVSLWHGHPSPSSSRPPPPL